MPEGPEHVIDPDARQLSPQEMREASMGRLEKTREAVIFPRRTRIFVSKPSREF